MVQDGYGAAMDTRPQALNGPAAAGLWNTSDNLDLIAWMSPILHELKTPNEHMM
jgi:hypothetical protein